MKTFSPKNLLIAFEHSLFFFWVDFFDLGFSSRSSVSRQNGGSAFLGALLALAGIMFSALAFIPFGKKGNLDTSKSISGQEPPGQLNVKPITCPPCGAQVDPSTVSLSAEGTLTMKCLYCGGIFFIDESPKW